LSDPTAASPTPEVTGRARHKRRLSNYLLDPKLQLRYVVVITLLSVAITGVLGFMIFDQQRTSTERIEADLQELVGDQTDVASITSDYEQQDRMLVVTMFVAGSALILILSLFVVIMTHRVAGPLFKTSHYFDEMAEGKLSVVTPLRRGDMLQDFFANFKDMHDVVRARTVEDVERMRAAAAALREAKGAELGAALDELERHLATRARQLG
jgi:nitrogen fixation/metabolism regulation signal transduction histidine kinase